MKTLDLNGSLRTEKGKTAAKKLRQQGLVPCILYGKDTENIDFTVSVRDLKDLIYTPNSYIISFNIDGKQHSGIIREAQYHPVSDDILHIDFVKVEESRPITIDIPVVISGNSEGVKQGGKLQIVSRKLKVSAMPKDLPDSLPVDISGLGLGKTIAVGDLNFEKLTILTPKTTTICAVKMTRAAMGAAAAEAATKK